MRERADASSTTSLHTRVHGPNNISCLYVQYRLACDASVVPLVENGEGEPLNVGRKTRTIPPAMRRAIDYGFAIEVLLQRSHRARDVSAETRCGASEA
jgi:hypothetical protein